MLTFFDVYKKFLHVLHYLNTNDYLDGVEIFKNLLFYTFLSVNMRGQPFEFIRKYHP